MKKLLFSLISCCITVLASAQVHEKLYIQTDREQYLPGETVFFQGRILSDWDSVSSLNMIIELWDDSMRRQASVILPVVDGTASGSIGIPRETGSKNFLLRAYTDISSSQIQPFQFVKPLFASAALLNSRSQVPVFFPEGGNLVSLALNHVYYYAPGSFSGVILNQRGDTLLRLNPDTRGTGDFYLVPEQGDKYSVKWTEGGNVKTIPLQVTTAPAVALRVWQVPDTLYFSIDKGGSTIPELQELEVQLMINSEPAYQVGLKMNNRTSLSYFIPLIDFKSGVAEFRVLGSDKKILASRPLLINRHSLDTVWQVECLKKSKERRGEQILHLQLKDTTLRFVSVSITDADRETGSTLSSQVQVAGLKGLLHTPGVTFPVTDPVSLDRWVMMNATIEQEVTAIRKVQPLSANKGLQLTGIVRKGKKLLTDKILIVGLRSDYAGKEIFKVKTDSEGKFVLDGLAIFGETYVHCRIPGQENTNLECTYSLQFPEIRITESFENEFKSMASAFFPLKSTVKEIQGADAAALVPEELELDEKIITLEEIKLTSNSRLAARKRLDEIEDKYINSTDFSGYYVSGETVDVLNDPTSINYNDLFTYIGVRLLHVNLRYINGQKQLMYFGRGIHGEMMITSFYLGNTRVERNLLDNITPDQVAAVKLVNYFVAEPGMPPAIGIFLKKPGDKGYWEKDRYQLVEQKITGYPVPQEFYHPDYTREMEKVKKDNRRTCYWNPYEIVQKGNAEIRFFSNDITTRFRVVVDGIAEDGSLIHLEKIIE